MTIVSNRDDTVVVTGLTVHAKPIRLAANSTNVELCVGGDFVPTRHIELDLDSNPPKYQLREDSDTEVDRFTLRLQKGDVEQLLIDASARSRGLGYEWTADINMIVGGGRQSFRVAATEGRPFLTAGCADGPIWSLDGPATSGVCSEPVDRS